jgi:hypothetical protein
MSLLRQVDKSPGLRIVLFHLDRSTDVVLQEKKVVGHGLCLQVDRSRRQMVVVGSLMWVGQVRILGYRSVSPVCYI